MNNPDGSQKRCITTLLLLGITFITSLSLSWATSIQAASHTIGTVGTLSDCKKHSNSSIADYTVMLIKVRNNSLDVRGIREPQLQTDYFHAESCESTDLWPRDYVKYENALAGY